ncbi:MAG TPA: aminotransferase class V-fold PLP-dependent enzyme [Acidimicrobiia bacterium]|nr:aminotransferase class V-fold PLP-dependent enzyme [Acidimicrobiia bacterium]
MKEGFSRFIGANPRRLHAAAHSHHPWPDVTYEAHVRAWEDAARLMDDKWDHVFGTVMPSARRRIADVLNLSDPDTLVFAPNTHEFIQRIASTLPARFRVLTTGSEFHSFSRQLARWEEARIAEGTRIPAEPFATFPARFAKAYAGHDLVFVSHVHYNSGYVVPDLEHLVGSLTGDSVVVVDGYHGFMAVPTDLGPVADRAFYMAGGYKYAMAGEGACFLHVPPDAPARPVDTGWWAAFESLAGEAPGVTYSPGGQRFAGATTDPSGIYRLEAVLGWLERQGLTVERIHSHVAALQQRLLDQLDPGFVAQLIPDRSEAERGHFLTFRHTAARQLYDRLHGRGVITDHRGGRWRVGLGIYHDDADVDRLAEEVNACI